MSQQGQRQTWFRAQSGKSGTYGEDIINAALSRGFTGGTANEAQLFLANNEQGSSYAGLPEALQAWSQASLVPATNWSSLGNPETTP